MSLNLALRLGARAAAAGGAKALTFLQGTTDPTNTGTFTFAAQNLGSASSDRRIIVGFGARATTTTALTVSSVTVAGVSATINVQQSNTPSNAQVACIATAHVPSGTSGDVVVTLSRSCIRAGLVLYSATGLTSQTASDTDSSTATAPATSAVTIPSPGFLVGFATSGTGSSATWSGLTEDYDAQAEAASVMTSASSSTPGTPTVSATIGGSEPVGVFASW